MPRALNIVDHLRAKEFGEAIAVVSEGGPVSYRELFENVATTRKILEASDPFRLSGLPRIGVKIPDGLDHIVVALAVLESGACFVPIAPELGAAEERTLVEMTALHGVVRLSGGELVVESCSAHEPEFPVAEFEALNPAFIRFSSGTTGRSKGVVLSHESLLARISAAQEGLQFALGDRILWTLPMAHHFVVTLVLYLHVGATTVLAKSTDPADVYRQALAERAEVFYGSPMHFGQLAQCLEAGPIPSLRLAISTAAPLTEEIAENFFQRFGLPLTQALGVIEVGLPIVNFAHAGEAPTALGKLLPAYEARLEDEELQLSGPGFYDAYLLPWAPRVRDTWFATGDLVERSSEGLFTMKGRRKSVINVGGLKVFPEEVEAILAASPTVAECRVFGVEHPVMGQYPAAELVLARGCEPLESSELRKYCEESLSSYKIPLQFSYVDELPRTVSGKIKRH
jgi:long-chain acyl-CoA synthetase